MGMAASQARYLSLTARKSNVEYQGQQINQERTTLATESSNLYQEMLGLKVPTPPNTSDYYNTQYNINIDNLKNYNFVDFVRYGENTGATVNWTNYSADIFSANNLNTNSSITGNTITINGGSGTTGGSTATVSWIDPEAAAYKEFKNALSHTTNSSFYKTDEFGQLVLDDVYMYETTEDGVTINNYLSKTAYDALQRNAMAGSIPVNTQSMKVVKGTATESTFVKGTFTNSTNGRLATFSVTDPSAASDLKAGMIYNLSPVQQYDEDGYNEAYKDYTHQKDLYDKAIEDINAETEQIQQKDKTLELNLNQLDTEQNAIQTEMESVQKVIEKNVEDTFNIFA